MCPNLTLDVLIPVLRAHFKEKDATLVFTELSNGAQGIAESENDFCLRMMALRQKVLLMSREENGQYTENLVQTQFQKSLATGFRREAVRQQLRGVLKAPIGDIQLLQEISDVVTTETEHDTKVKPKAEPKVEPKGTIKATTNNIKADKPGNAAKPANPIIAEITKLTSQVSQLSGLHSGLQGEIDKLKQNFQGAANWGNANGWVNNSLGTGNQNPNGAAQHNSVNQTQRGGPNPTGGVRGRGRGRGSGRGGPSAGRGGMNTAFGRRWGCPDCVYNGVFCNHCFQCGEEGHTYAHCTKDQKNEEGDQV
jgi:hypothetical protein